LKPVQPILIDGPAGRLEVAVNDPGGPHRGVALIAHPHPLHGGTMDNKVVVTLAKAFFRLGYYCVRPNYRGVGDSIGNYDEGRGETENVLAAARFAQRGREELPLVRAGFSFGAEVQSHALAKLNARRLVLVAPIVGRLEHAQVPADTLLIHGEHDELQPLAEVFVWAKPRHLPVVVVPGASHFFHQCLNILAAIIANQFRCA
jgi:alpha/beta superfamily hydrolase